MMYLTQLKEKIDDALKYYPDYEIALPENVELDLDGCGVTAGKHSFLLDLMISPEECDDYHIKEDEYMEYCETCDIYYNCTMDDGFDDCPACKLDKARKFFKAMKALMSKVGG